MGILDRLENAIEKGMNSAFSKVFRSGLRPVDISSAMEQAMERSARPVEGKARGTDTTLVAPNVFTVLMSPGDFNDLQSSGLDVLVSQLSQDLVAFADTQGYLLAGPIEVELLPSKEEARGSIQVSAKTKRGAVAPAAGAAPSPEHPIIDVDGEKWLLTEEVTVIGRSSSADITVDDSGVSRRHLELRITPHGVIATDLDSTNGMHVEGHKVEAATLVDGNQVTIGRTNILFWTHAAG